MTETTATSRPLVVGVDGSPESILALKYAQRLAPAFGADILALYVWHYPLGYAPLPITWSPDEDARVALRDALHTAFGDRTPENVHAETRGGDPAKELVEESENAEMIIVGSRGHGGFVGLLIGAVSAQVAEHAKCPVLVVHEPEPTEAAKGEAVAAKVAL